MLGTDARSTLSDRVRRRRMSAWGQKRRSDRAPDTAGLPSTTDLGERRERVRFVPATDSCTATTAALFDHLVGAHQKCLRNSQTKRFCRLEVDYQFESCRLLDRQIIRLCTLKDAIDVRSRAFVQLNVIEPICQQAAHDCKILKRIDRGQTVRGSKSDNLFAVSCGKCTRQDDHPAV